MRSRVAQWMHLRPAIAVIGMMAGACAQQTPVSPTPTAGSVAAADAAQLASANSELICHARGNGTFVPLSVNAASLPGHLAHGDGRPGGPAPGGAAVFSSTCTLVNSIAGTWLGESITFDSNSGCGRDRNVFKLTLTQTGADVSGDVYWKILESFFPPDVGKEQQVPLTSGAVNGNTFTFTYGPPQMGIVATATITGTTMTGTIGVAGSSCPTPNTFVVTRQ